MYSGSTLNKYSGQILGAHQKIDRVARNNLENMMPNSTFPSLKLVLSFEGDKGPDAIKRKSPAKDEPWHYFQPFDDTDTQLLDLIEQHYKSLTRNLKKHDLIRSGFEAAWLAHAMVDGLTPAHHYPYEEKLDELRGGLGKETRTTIRKKIFIPGAGPSEMALKNWKMWGPKGLFTTHAAFEWGVATLIAPIKMPQAAPKTEDVENFNNQNIKDWFRQQAVLIAGRDYYERFCDGGWTMKLAKEVKTELVPDITRAVTLAWVGAAKSAGLEAGDRL